MPTLTARPSPTRPSAEPIGFARALFWTRFTSDSQFMPTAETVVQADDIITHPSAGAECGFYGVRVYGGAYYVVRARSQTHAVDILAQTIGYGDVEATVELMIAAQA